jgi:hypothetical protein
MQAPNLFLLSDFSLLPHVPAVLLVLVAEILEDVSVGLRTCVTLIVNGFVYVSGSSIVISTSMWGRYRG